MEKRGQFTFYRSYWEALSSLPNKDRLAVLEAICLYALDGTETPLIGIQQAVFALMKPTADTGRRKAENGRRGGFAPKNQDSNTEANRKQNESKQEANRKQNESKTEANRKQNESKTEANRKQNESKKEKEKEKEIEIEIEIEIEKEYECTPPKSPSPGETKQGQKQEPSLGAELETVFSDWLRYKAEKRQAYKPTGLKSLRSQVVSKAAEYGEQAVADLIRLSMASNWQGIAFDRLSQPHTFAQSNKQRIPYGGTGVLGNAEIEAIQAALREDAV